ncbi:Vms1/Ankzf1 family peptidyl-tRNA hydrolase [Halobaculum sp. MBLA0147]|uniref:Vms1/Ankzf1 family peptidyl-tRNA hydrolase n=1 Tax=Halobaculum sp. MBLA0147 TaxID=3079934 RepID=UPI003524457B
MLDRLLGRASLQAEIDELTEERDSLAAQLEAESDRRREAVRKRQDAEERVNRLEDRIAELEDRLDRSDEGTDAAVEVRGRETLRRERLSEVLDRLESVGTGREGALSAAVGADPPAAVADAFGDRAPLVRRVAPAICYRDDAGLVSVALDPPIHPEPFHEWGSSFRVDRSWFEPTGRFLFALIRSDSFVAGVYAADERVAFDRFASDVTSEHDKGGFSQARFERRREEEIDAHVERADERLSDLVTEHGLDRVILVGEDGIVDELAGHADHTASADATGDDEDALDRAFRDFWSTQLTLL